MTALLDHPAALEFVSLALDRLSVPERRGYLDWAESEFVVPDGRYKGEVFHRDFQPASALFLEEMDRGGWRRFAVTGPRQGGKTMIGYVIPVLYTLFELGETVVLGVPDLKLASDKWQIDLLPAIDASRYRSRLPTRGPGSRGGKIEDTIDFGGGVYLKFMTGGGGDAARSGFTSRVAFITEVDKLDVTGGQSREADKVTQIFGVTGSYGHDEVHGMESTASFSRGRVWREFQAGTQSAIFCPCPHCRGWVCPGRDCLKGWREAESSGEAEERAGWHCPACGEQISEAQRAAMNRAGVLVHKGQKVEWADEVSPTGPHFANDDESGEQKIHGIPSRREQGDRRGLRATNSTSQDAFVRGAHTSRITGPTPATRTFGFRFDAFNNLFWDAKYVAAREWAAANAPDEENSEKEIHQFVWAIPYDPPGIDQNKLEWRQIAQRQRDNPRGQAPEGTLAIVVSADPGKYNMHWIAKAVLDDATEHVIDYGIIDVPSGSMDELRAILSALRTLREAVSTGYVVVGRDEPMKIKAGVVDAGNWDDAVYEFVRESEGWYASKGFACTRYATPKRQGPGRAAWVGKHAHAVRFETKGAFLVEFDADFYKTEAHNRLMLPPGTAGAVTLFHADFREHTHFGKHCISEEPTNEYHGGQHVVRWLPKGSTATFKAKKQNHFWDCLVLSGLVVEIEDIHDAPAEVDRAPVVAEKKEPRRGSVSRRSDRPWLLTNR